MNDRTKEIMEWVIPGVFVFLILTSVFGYIGAKNLNATRKSNRIEVGDTFKVEYVTDNPYEDSFIFGGRIIDKKSNYILYVTSKGDTCTTNIRDPYTLPKFFKVTVYKNK